MTEHKLFKDLPGSDRFHSCILSAFAFDYHFFDRQLRRQLQNKGIMNIIVMCDAHIFDQSFGTISGGASHLLSDYTVIPIVTEGCFHPKVHAFIGDDDLMLHIGSGNLTSGGFGKNDELFSTLSVGSREDPTYPIVIAGLDYLHGFLKGKEGFVQTQLEWIVKHCGLLTGFDPASSGVQVKATDNIDLILLFNSSHSIYAQLTAMVPSDEVRRILICSPFHDTDGTFLRQIGIDYENAELEVLVQDGATIIPKSLHDFNHVTFYNWFHTQRGLHTNQPFNHSKIFLFETDQEVYLLHGSPNATASAFGLSSSFRNEEIALLYRYKVKSDLPDLGIETTERIDPTSVRPPTRLPAPESAFTPNGHEIEVFGAESDTARLRVFHPKIEEKEVELCFINSFGEEISRFPVSQSTETTLWFVKQPDLRGASAVFLTSGYQTLSQTVLIHALQYLYKCDPDPENRRLNKILLRMQEGRLTEFDLVSHLSALIPDLNTNTTKRRAARRSKSTGSGTKPATYDEAVERSKQEEATEHFHSPVVRTWQVFYRLIADLSQDTEENAIDQEEEGYRHGGGDGKEMPKRPGNRQLKVSSRRAFEREQKRLLSAFQKYVVHLQKSLDKGDHVTDVKDLTYFLLLYPQLLLLADRKCDVAGETDILIPIKGPPGESDSFESLSWQMLGRFIQLFTQGRFHQYETEYERLHFDDYRLKCAALIQIGIAVHPDLEVSLDLLSCLYLNTVKCAVRPGLDQILGLYRDLSLEDRFDVNVSKTLSVVENHGNSILSDLGTDWVSRQFTEIDGLGVVKVLKKVPERNPKSIQFEYPGYGYDAFSNAFEYPLWFSVETKKLLMPVSSLK